VSERLSNKVAIVVSAGSTPGGSMGNGRATATLFAREGAAVLLVSRAGASATATGWIKNSSAARASRRCR